LIAEVFRNQSMGQRIDGLSEAAVDARARVSYYYAFGVLPDVQKEMERYYGTLTVGKFTNGDGVERMDMVIEPGLILNTEN
jgi:hypothetical protein